MSASATYRPATFHSCLSHDSHYHSATRTVCLAQALHAVSVTLGSARERERDQAQARLDVEFRESHQSRCSRLQNPGQEELGNLQKEFSALQTERAAEKAELEAGC